MIEQNGSQTTVVRSDQRLLIQGTRLTITHVMDYLKADWPPKLIRDSLNLTDKQISDVLAYIEAHRDEVETDYQDALQLSEDSRRYWEKYNRERSRRAGTAVTSANPDQEKLLAKLGAWKKRRNIA